MSNKLRNLTFAAKVLFASVVCCFTACSSTVPEELVQLEPLPAMVWHERNITPFWTKDAWEGQRIDWNIVTSTFECEFSMPDALETKLQHADRELWRNVIANVELYGQNKRDALVYSNVQLPTSMSCEPPSSQFSLHQRAQLQKTLQLHRNVLWRLGRLEMSSREIKATLRQFLPQYSGGRIKDAEANVVDPMRKMAAQIQDIQSRYPTPNGVWAPGELHFRMARLSQLAPIFLQAKTSIEQWNANMLSSSRWQYLASTSDAYLEALNGWVKEYETLISAFRYLSASIQSLEQSFQSPNNLVAYPCINQNLKRLRILSNLFDNVLPMQWSLVKAENDASRVQDRVLGNVHHDYLSDEVQKVQQKLSAQLSMLSRTADLLLVLWDETNYKFWTGLPDFLDPIHHHSETAVESSETWQIMYHDISTSIHTLSQRLQAEPEQPLDKRGKPYAAPIFKIIEDLSSPSRIDEVEHGLLAISEIEAHMLSVRDELMRLCQDGACHKFPEAELAHSPRSSFWIVSWRQSPVSERTLGHSLIVLKLCQLHLSRLVQRLTEIYAWFAETSNADITWKALKSWQRIWTLYAEPNGTYANFLRSISALDSQIDSMAKPDTRRAQSETLLELLRLQAQLFELTIDYARFVDNKARQPVPFDDIMGTWEELQQSLEKIAELTQARDDSKRPVDAKTQKKVRRDIDR